MIPTQKNRQGMVLLIVLGMLGLFSLLAVTYMVYSGQSRTSGLIINRAKLQNPGKLLYDPNIILQVLRGNADGQSAFAGHSLLGDVYGRRAIEGNTRRFINGTNSSNYDSPQYNVWNDTRMGAVLVGSGALSTGSYISSDLPFCKVALDPNIQINGVTQRLNHIDDAYNARIFTMLEGPLTGHSFRILKYIGEENRILAGGSPAFPLAPTFNPPTDELSHSILINLQELPEDLILEGNISTAQAPPAASTKLKGTLGDFLASSPNTLFYKTNGEGYKFLINDAVYNGVGYGQDPTTGNLTQQVNNPLTNAPFAIGNLVGTALMPSYDYMSLNQVSGSTNEGFDVADYRDFWLANTNPNADTNYLPSEIIPSYHRPELVNYIWHSFAPTRSQFNALTTVQLREMLIQIDWACARALPLGIIDPPNSPNTGDPTLPFAVTPGGQMNLNFTASKLVPMVVDFRTWTSDPAQQDRLYTFLTTLTGWVDANSDGIGESAWDVDNDGDGNADSVWIDPGLPLITAPDGKMLKAMAAVHIVDLDSRINLNLAGDMAQAYDSPDRYLPSSGTYNSTLTPLPFSKQNADERIGRTSVTTDYSSYPYLSQGLGVGPAEIQFGHLFQNANNTHYAQRYANQQSFVQAIMSARNTVLTPTSSTPNTDAFRSTGYPGRQTDRIGATIYGGNDLAGRDMQSVASVSNADDSIYMWSDSAGNNYPTYGMPLLTRGKGSLALDRNGNPTTFLPNMLDSNGTLQFPENDILNDPYELSQDPQAEDAPFTLEELERVLRRFDGDVSNLSDRLSSIIRQDTTPASSRYSLMSEINAVITTRSHELRNLPIGFPGRDQLNYSTTPSSEIVDDMLKWIALVHEHTYRFVDTTQTDETTATQNDPSAIKSNSSRYGLPQLSPDIIRALFPIEFRYGLRMDINRPFGNGLDNSPTSNGVVDEPGELNNSGNTNSTYFDEKGTAWTAGGLPLVHGTYDQHGYDEINGIYRYYPNDGSGVAQVDLTQPNAARNNPYFDLSSRQLFARQLYCLAQLLIPPDYQLPLMTDLTPTLNRAWYKRRARILAQWAVNVVDFRDSDAVMTRFSYDYLPFGIGTHGGMTFKAPGWNPDHGDVVWGMEYPELLISETLALHDKRVRVRPQPTATPVQFRIPQGSLYVELYNPRTAPQIATAADSREQPALPKELYYYDTTTNTVKLQLSKLAPMAPFDTRYGRQPVWRIGVTPPTGTLNAPATTQDQLLNQRGPFANAAPLPSNQLMESTPTPVTNSQGAPVDAVNLNGLVEDLTAGAGVGPIVPGTRIQFERMIWFTNQAPDGVATTGNYGGLTRIPNLIDQGSPTTLKNRVFYNKIQAPGNNAELSALIPLGGYTVLAPRDNTYIGSRESTRPPTDPWNEPSSQRISYLRTTTGAFEVTNLAGTITSAKFALALRNPTVLIQQAEPPSAAWVGPGPTEPLKQNYFYSGTNGNEGIGLNVSEPLPLGTQYYLRPDSRVNSNDNAAANLPITPGGFASTEMRPDGYADFGGGATGETDIFDDQNGAYTNPVLSGFDTQHRTLNDFRQLYLQRLADPMQGYDPVWNPYITIDVMPVDLSLYTGENTDQNYDGAITTSPTSYAFESRFKDGRSIHEYVGVAPPVNNSTLQVLGTTLTTIPASNAPGATFTTRSYFSASTARLFQTPVNPTPPATGPVYFPRELGYHWQGTPGYSVSSMTLGYLNVGHQIQPDVTAFNPTTYQALGRFFDGFGPPQKEPSGNGTYPNLAGSPDPNFYNIAGLLWPNRPFANASEITQVPFTPPGLLGALYTNGLGFTFNPPTVNVFDDAQPNRFTTPFGHLLNFFDFESVFNNNIGGAKPPLASDNATELTIPQREPYWMRSTAAPSKRSGLGYLLELIETAPLYKETAKILDPRATDISATDATVGALSQSYSGPITDGSGSVDLIRKRMLVDYRYPHNKQWSYASPGKINMNTISDERVFRGLESLVDTDPSVHLAATGTGQVPVSPHAGATPTFWALLRLQMRGYQYYTGLNPNTPASLPIYSGASINIQPNMDNRLPSQFVGAFQSPFNAGITPPVATANLPLIRTYLPATTTLRRPVDSTSPISPVTVPGIPLMAPDKTPTRDLTAMPFSLYQRFGRLTNLVTNQSNVFAVWVTVGLFEWDPVNGLGKEYVGTDGKTDRQRSFYIIDRTVPVAYREGNTFNVEKAILLRRNITRRY